MGRPNRYNYNFMRNFVGTKIADRNMSSRWVVYLADECIVYCLKVITVILI